MDLISILFGFVLGGLLAYLFVGLNAKHQNQTSHTQARTQHKRTTTETTTRSAIPSSATAAASSSSSPSFNGPVSSSSSSVGLSGSSISSLNSISQNAYTAVFEPVLKRFLQTLNEDAKDGWLTFVERNGVVCAKKEISGQQIPIVRGSCIVCGPPSWVQFVWTNLDLKKKFDPNFLMGRKLEKVDAHTCVNYLEYVRKWPTSARDFVSVENIHHIATQVKYEGQPVNAVAVVHTSVAHKDAPERQGYVRAVCNMAGLYIQPILLDGQLQSKVEYIAHINLNGSLPSAIVSMVSNDQPLVVERLANYARECTADMPKYLPTAPDSKPSSPHSTSAVSAPIPPTAANGALSPSSSSLKSNVSVSKSALKPMDDDEDDEEDEGPLPPLSSAVLPIPIVSDANIVSRFVALSDSMIRDLVKDSTQTEGWKKLGVSHEVEMYVRKDEESHISSFMGIGVIKAPPRDIYQKILSPEFRRQYDRMLKHIRVLGQIKATPVTPTMSATTPAFSPLPTTASSSSAIAASIESEPLQVQYMRHETRKCLVKTAREFVLLVRGKDEEKSSGKYLIAARSVDFPVPDDVYDKDKKATKAVRAEVLHGGWVLERPAPNVPFTKVTYIGCIDFKGKLPQAVINLIGKRQPLCIHYIRPYLESLSKTPK